METADLLSLKPIIYAANMDEDGFANQEGNEYLKKVRALAGGRGQRGAAHLRQAGAGHR